MQASMYQNEFIPTPKYFSAFFLHYTDPKFSHPD